MKYLAIALVLALPGCVTAPEGHSQQEIVLDRGQLDAAEVKYGQALAFAKALIAAQDLPHRDIVNLREYVEAGLAALEAGAAAYDNRDAEAYQRAVFRAGFSAEQIINYKLGAYAHE